MINIKKIISEVESALTSPDIREHLKDFDKLSDEEKEEYQTVVFSELRNVNVDIRGTTTDIKESEENIRKDTIRLSDAKAKKVVLRVIVKHIVDSF